MNCWNKCFLVVGLSVSLFVGKALAEEPQTISGFHGDIMIGGMWSFSESRLVSDDDNKKLSSLADGDGKESEVGLLGMGNLSYTTLAGTQLFASFDGDLSTGIKLGVAAWRHTYINKSMMLATTVSAVKSEYDHSHPVFNKTRDEETYGVSSTLTWFNPLGCENYFVNVMGAYAKTDSNIDFFDSTDTMVGMGVGYRF